MGLDERIDLADVQMEDLFDDSGLLDEFKNLEVRSVSAQDKHWRSLELGMEKYNEIGGGCGFDAYGNELQDSTPVQTLPTGIFHNNEIYQYINPGPHTASNCVLHQANNQQHHKDMLNYSQPMSQHHWQQFASTSHGVIYGEDSQQRQHRTSFLGINQSAARQEARHLQKPQLTSHYCLPQCYPNQAGRELHQSGFDGFSTTGDFPIQQVAPDCYANANDPYRGHTDVSLNENLATVTDGEGLISDTTTATNPLYEQHQPNLFGHEQIYSFTANKSNECDNYSMLPPPPPLSLIDDGDLSGGQATQNYYSPCGFAGGEPVNQALNSSVLKIGHQNAQSSNGSLEINLGSEHIVKLGKVAYATGDGGSGAELSESDDQMHQTRQHSNFQYSKVEQFDETTSQNQSSVVRDDQLMNNQRFGPERSSGRVLASSHQQDYIDMRSSGNLSQEWLDMICRQMIEHMDSFGICVIDNFLGSIKGELILGEVKQLFSHRSYSTGRLVSHKLDSSSSSINASNDPAKTIRNDRVIWVDGCEEGCEEINNLIQTLCSVITNSSRLSLYSNNGLDKVVISKRTKAHVACYPGNGTRYIKHVDNPNGDGRVITAIYYLNKSWRTKQDGGLLRMFPSGVETVANIEPLFDRVLFFWSDRRNPHEVLPAYRDRYAITVWYIGDNRSQET